MVGTQLWEGPWFQSSEHARNAAHGAVITARNGELFCEERQIQGTDKQAFVDFSVRLVTNEGGEVTELIPEGRDIRVTGA